MKVCKFAKVLFSTAILFASVGFVSAQQTTAFTYQGQLRDGGTNANGTYGMTFKLFDAVSGGTQIGGTLAGNPTVANGLFSVELDFGANAFNGSARWLDITIQAGTNAPETLTPRVQVMPAPYALFAATAGTVTNHAILNTHLATNAVASSNIQSGAITTALIANGAVTNQNLSPNAVGTTNLQDSAVTDAKIVSVGGAKVTGTVGNATNALFASELNTFVTTLVNSNVVSNTVWRVYPSLSSGPGVNSHDLVVSANGAAQMVIRPYGQGSFANGFPISPVPNSIQPFLSSGTFITPSNVTRIMVEMWGGGGGGGNGHFSQVVTGCPENCQTNDVRQNGGGGGSGGYGVQVFTVVPGQSYPVVVGARGGANTAGGNSSFLTLQAGGGGAGQNATVNSSGLGGAGGGITGSAIPANGHDGSGGDPQFAGFGGDAFRGGAGGFGFPLPHRAGGTPGGGGGGGGGATSGSEGGQGVVVIHY
jgi:hypothetical protein